MRMNGRRVVPALVILLTLGIGIVIGTMVSKGVRAARSGAVAPDARPLAMPSPVDLSNSFAQISDSLEPSVVNVNTESTIRVSRRRFHMPDDSPFNDFFDRFFNSPDAPPGDIRQQSLGSGIILDKHGYILTNYHVIMQSSEDKAVDRINVSLHGDENSKYKAKVIGTDKLTDLAVIKIEAGKPLAAAELGNSDAMRVGDWVLAIGSPFGLDSTVTAGIISAKGRNQSGEIEPGPEGQFKRYIQTDAAINPGNSGGPLVNLAGQVIGINTAIATRRGTNDGVGFAIPSNTARKVYNSLISSGSVPRGAIGVQFYGQPNPALLRSFGADHGVVINSVESGSPAERAGLKRGDVITGVDGKAVGSGDDLVAIVSDTDIGKRLRLEYLRGGKRLNTEVEVADRNKIIAEQTAGKDDEGGSKPDEGGTGILGVTVKNLTAVQAQELADQLHLGSKQGILVSEIDPGGFASDMGVQRGDIILSVNHQAVNSVEDFNRAQSTLKSGADVLFLIARRSGPRTFTTLYLAERLP